MENWRIEEHPILSFNRGREVSLSFEGRPVKAYENETVAAALYANGTRIFSRSIKYRRPRGFFCAIGRCASCMMEIDGIPNVRTCMVKVKEGMKIRRQKGFPSAEFDLPAFALNRMDLSPDTYLRRFTHPKLVRTTFQKVMRRFTGISAVPPKADLAPPRNNHLEVEVAIVGGGPAGLYAAAEAGRLCESVLVLEDKDQIGGQLLKQTHKFFGNVTYCAQKRGFKLAEEMTQKLADLKNVKISTGTSVIGFYPKERMLVAVKGEDDLLLVKAKKYIVSTGAYERTLLFENNDIPGVYGAGGVQTLMNIYGIRPGRRGLVVGSGNVGLILSYQLLQAGVEVVGIVEALPRIGGYLVHASKIRRLGVPIYTKHTILRALGKTGVEGAVIAQIDEKFNLVPGSEREVECDFICVAVGLNPTYDLIQHFNPKMIFLPDLGGFVPVRDVYGRVTKDAYVAGDCSGIEEAATSMLAGAIAGLHISLNLGHGGEEEKRRIEEFRKELEEERSSPFSERIKKGLTAVTVNDIEAS